MASAFQLTNPTFVNVKMDTKDRIVTRKLVSFTFDEIQIFIFYIYNFLSFCLMENADLENLTFIKS